jgi:S-layer homology domain
VLLLSLVSSSKNITLIDISLSFFPFLMKKILTSSACLLIAFTSIVSASSFTPVLDWMYSNGLTKYSTESDYRPSDQVTRGEIAKFFVKYAEYKKMSKGSNTCSFNDIGGYDSTLIPFITQACEYGLMKGSQGNFRPNANLTEAEAVTVIARTMFGLQNENGNPRWSEYYNIASTYNIISGRDVWALDRKATRATVGTWLYNASTVDTAAAQDEGTEDVEKILEEIFGSL